MRARVAGKAAVAARIVWSLEAGQLRARCLAVGRGYFVVQLRSSAGWENTVTRGVDPVALLQRMTGAGLVAQQVRERAAATRAP